LIGSRGLLVANEVIKPRAFVLAENLAKWGHTNTIVTQNDPSVFASLPGFFDVILADAPCSGEGMFRDHIAVNEWSDGNAYHCSERQKRILQDVWPALKENGILIYSTCTFNPEENERNVKWLTSKQKAETIRLNISDFKDIKVIDHHGINGYCFCPGRIKGDGLFISVIRNTGNNGRMKTGIKMKNFSAPKNADLEIIKEWTTFSSENIIRSGEEIHYFPGREADYYLLCSHLRIISKGTRICTVKRNGYIPAHELVLSDGIRKDAFHKAELDLSQSLAYLRRDNIVPRDIPKGWFIPTYMGINLGFCNNTGSRINNYYPVGWRIRMSIPEPGTKNIIFWDS
jgi:NOL1/NOP2/fmu family ribosome biogenesis protein